MVSTQIMAVFDGANTGHVEEKRIKILEKPRKHKPALLLWETVGRYLLELELYA